MRVSSLAKVLTLQVLAGVASIASATSFTFTGGFDTFTVPTTGIYNILAFGAQGGSGAVFNPLPGGLGAEIGGDFLLTAGETLSIAVGGMGGSSLPNFGASGGGGGGSFVVLQGSPAIPLVIAGGGGGGRNTVGGDGLTGTAGGSTFGGAGGINGNGGQAGGDRFGAGGGGGFLSNGGSASGVGGASFFNGLAGGAASSASGAGGGGGYSGGGGGTGGPLPPGGGGGSFNGSTFSNADLIALAGVNSGNGSVTINLVSDMTGVPEPGNMSLLGAALIGLATLRRRKCGRPLLAVAAGNSEGR